MVTRQPLNLNAVAENFTISRPAISKHIKILSECGLIIIKQHGRERFCEAKLDQLAEVAQWMNQYKAFWTKKLDALEIFLSNEKPVSTKRKSSLKKKRK
jgi:DNA-binding transcriptional ArsR family regulator